MYEEDLPTGVTRSLYPCNGQVIAQRSTDASGLISLHADNLGSISVVTNQNQAVVSRQDFDPWGAIRSGGIPQTALNDTGQRRDGTGLLYYHARSYDPVLARFVSADSVVPGVAEGKGGGAATLGLNEQARSMLTVDFHEPQFVKRLSDEHQFTLDHGFWFQLNGSKRNEAKDHWGPKNPQALNRYAYVLNNPLRYTDPTGYEPELPTNTPNSIWHSLGNGWYARVDRFNVGGQASHEIHVFKGGFSKAHEVGILGKSGWIARHGHTGAPPKGITSGLWNKLNGLNVDALRHTGRLPTRCRGYSYLPRWMQE